MAWKKGLSFTRWWACDPNICLVDQFRNCYDFGAPPLLFRLTDIKGGGQKKTGKTNTPPPTPPFPLIYLSPAATRSGFKVFFPSFFATEKEIKHHKRGGGGNEGCTQA